MSVAARNVHTPGARGIRRGCSLANSAGTYEFAREHPATSRAPVAVRATRGAHAAVSTPRAPATVATCWARPARWRGPASECVKFRPHERAGTPPDPAGRAQRIATPLERAP
jgi:hypothetical protein